MVDMIRTICDALEDSRAHTYTAILWSSITTGHSHLRYVLR